MSIIWSLPLFVLVAQISVHQAEEDASTAALSSINRADYVPVPEPSEKAIRYYQSGNVLWTVNTLWAIGLPALFVFSGLSARLRDRAYAISGRWLFATEIYIVFLFALLSFYTLPLDFYGGYVRQHSYGLSNQTLGKWCYDWLVSHLVLIVAACLVFWIPYLLLTKSPRWWWLYTSIALLPVLFAGMMVMPIWVAPLFNDFGEVKNKDLEAKILELADRSGIDSARVFEVNKSVDTKAINAYVVGFLATKRIVLWDTLLKKAPEKEILFIMAHEMGHFVLNHLVQGILVAAVLILLTLFLVHQAAGYFLGRFAGRFGFDRLSDIASLPLILMLIHGFLLVVMPIGLAFSRHIEHEADRFGLEITQDNHSAALSFVELEEENLGIPRPGWFHRLWRGSHPSVGERIDFCNKYRPWEKGEPLKYGYLFREDKVMTND